MTYATETMPPALVGQVQRRVGPPRRLRVSFACNDPENPGRVWAAQPESLYRVGKHPWDAELRYRTWRDGIPVWTPDHNEATRYCRRIEEAFQVLDEFVSKSSRRPR